MWEHGACLGRWRAVFCAAAGRLALHVSAQCTPAASHVPPTHRHMCHPPTASLQVVNIKADRPQEDVAAQIKKALA